MNKYNYNAMFELKSKKNDPTISKIEKECIENEITRRENDTKRKASLKKIYAQQLRRLKNI